MIIFLATMPLQGQTRYMDDPGVNRSYMLNSINKIREEGCRCGHKQMKPVPRLKWNKLLEYSAHNYAREMHTYDFFSHRSVEGKDIGERLDELSYKWQYAGENLAVGQRYFDVALKDWMKSRTHCEMIMNPNMSEMGLAKFGKYWVNHFASPMPKNTKRVRTRYREGN